MEIDDAKEQLGSEKIKAYQETLQKENAELKKQLQKNHYGGLWVTASSVVITLAVSSYFCQRMGR